MAFQVISRYQLHNLHYLFVIDMDVSFNRKGGCPEHASEGGAVELCARLLDRPVGHDHPILRYGV